MSHLINPFVGTEVGAKLSKDYFWFKHQFLSNQVRTKSKEDKRSFRDVYVYTVHNIEKENRYYIMVNNKHELLFDTDDFNQMLTHIERIKSVG